MVFGFFFLIDLGGSYKLLYFRFSFAVLEMYRIRIFIPLSKS